MQELKQFQDYISLNYYSDKTIKSYKYHIIKFLRYYKNDLRQENVLKHLLYLKNKGYKPSSLAIARAALFYFFNKVLKKKIIIDIPKPKRTQSLPKPLDREIIIKLIKVIRNLKHRTLIELLYSSGVRLEEVVNIKWDDLDFINNTVRINKGKGKKDRLTILSNLVVKHLMDLKELKPDNNDYVFFSEARIHTHITTGTVQKVLENASIKLGLSSKATPHQLRHSFATHLLENGTDIRYIQELLGHASTKTTEIYTKVTKNNLSKIESPLDKLDLTDCGDGKD